MTLLPYLMPKVLLPSRQEAARQGVTSILEVGSHIRTTEPCTTTHACQLSFHSNYDLLIEDSVIPKTPHIYGTLIDTSPFHVVVYFEVRTRSLPFPLSYIVRRVYDVPENILRHFVSVRSTIAVSSM
jgi:hypothetical protein